MAWNLSKIALVAGGTAVGGALCFFTAGAAAPAVGAFIGTSFMGLSGAAATSAGLAALGGGALAAGGGGMAAGTALIVACMTGAGGLLTALGMGTVANFFRDSDKRFEEALSTQKDVAKAQEIIREQWSKIDKLKRVLKSEQQSSAANEAKIAQLQEAIAKLSKAVSLKQERLETRFA